MPRIRTVKPEFWLDKKIRAVSRDARLLFIGLWNLADDSGLYRADPIIIKAQLFPADDLDAKPLLRELEDQGLIRTYAANDEEYLCVFNFLKHQRIDKPSPPRYPLPPEEVDEPSTNTSGALDEGSATEKEEETEPDGEKEMEADRQMEGESEGEAK